MGKPETPANVGNAAYPQGFRLPDTREGELPQGIAPGAFWKVLDDNGAPKIKTHPGKLTEECWAAVVPVGDKGGFGIANLYNHTVREEDDGSISVRPGDGSSNSILVQKGAGGPSWHGYIERGVFREA